MKVVLINGSGGSGKDTTVKLLKPKLQDKYNIYNIFKLIICYTYQSKGTPSNL